MTRGRQLAPVLPAEPMQGGTFSPSLFVDFVAYIDRTPRTARAYLCNLRQFAAFLRYTDRPRPERADVLAFRDYLTRDHIGIQYAPDVARGYIIRRDPQGQPLRIRCRPGTVKQYLQAVRAFFAWTEAAGLYPNIARNVHAPQIRADVHRKEALAPEDVAAIESEISRRAGIRSEAAARARKDRAGRIQRAAEQNARARALYLLAVNAGLRCVELSRANVGDLETIRGQAWLFVHGKGHTEADAKKALAPPVAEAVRAYLETRRDRPTPSGPLFVATGNRSGGQRLDPCTISKQLKKAMQAAGYDSDRLTAHSLRHTAGTAAMQATGGNLYAVQHYMRHANPATTEIYLHIDTERQDAETAAALWAYYHGGL